MSINEDRERLSQKHNLEWIRRDLRATEMVTVVRWNLENLRQDYFILGGLIPSNQIEETLSEQRISDVIENVWPEPLTYSAPKENKIRYFRWGVEEDEDEYGTEPLVIGRQFSKMKENYFEISEEFRLFHNLYHDRKTDTYIKIDDAGNEEAIAIVKPNEVQIRLKEIRQFLAVKEMCLSMLFEFSEYSRYTLEELGLSEAEREFKREGLICWRHDYCGETSTYREEFQSDSRLRGRILIEPLLKSKCGLGDFAEEPKYVEFIVDIDENGDEVYHTCAPDKLSDFPKENPDTAWKYTVVYFRKQVLEKYYNEPSKYNVEDSMVRCGSWGIQIDNHDPDKVCVLLKELGISLPYQEQLHWRANNIAPIGGVSETFFRRMVRGEWASSDQPDILFKQSYEQLQKVCNECIGWQLLKSLDPGDKFRLKRLRVPTVDEEAHFKDSVLDLANLLIERLNEKRLKDLIPVNKRKEIKRGINLLECVLDAKKVEEAKKHIVFLRSLWDLRSTRGGAHPECLDDPRYKRASKYFDLENLNRKEAFANILSEAVEFIDFLIVVVCSGKLSDNTGDNS